MLNSILLLGMPGGSEWILIVVVVLVLFGGKKIPELMRGMGKGVKEFKDGIKGEDDKTSDSKTSVEEK
jgi:sec-independent protein translocase protein TatA